MAQITIGDVSGSAQIDLPKGTLADKIGLKSLKTAADGFFSMFSKPVTDPIFHNAKFGAALGESIPLKRNCVDVAVGVNSALCVSRRADSPLFGKDNYDPIAIEGNECWVSFSLNTSLSTHVAAPLPDGFGVTFCASTAPEFATNLRIADAEAPNTTLLEAIQRTLQVFQILDSPEDFFTIPPDVIHTNTLAGTVKVGGSWCLPLAVNQLSLAETNLPFNQNVTVGPEPTISVSGAVAITSEFEVRVRRPDPNTLRLGLYKKKGKTFEASFAAGGAFAANIDQTTDLIGPFFDAVSPGINAHSLQSDDSKEIDLVLKKSIDRSLAISLNASCSAALTDEAAFVYEINISNVDQATKDALASTLKGDWTAVKKLPNAKELRNVITETLNTHFCLRVNLLGIYNYSSVADFVKSMRILKNDEDGSVTITDTATANRIAVASTPLATANNRLRAALNNGFVATATYQALLTGTGATSTLAASQNFLDYHETLDYRNALKQLNAGEVLGVMPVSAKAAMSSVGDPVFHARFAASRTYTNDDVLRFFFSDIQNFTPRSATSLTQTARQVLAGLLDPQDPTDRLRMVVLQDDLAWEKMTANPAQIVPPYYSDWVDITNWAAAIAKTAPLLADAIQFAKTVQGNPATNPTFMKKRAALAEALAAVTHKANAAFDKAFPVCVMSALAGNAAGTKTNVAVFEATWNSSTIFSNEVSRQAAAVRTQGA